MVCSSTYISSVFAFSLSAQHDGDDRELVVLKSRQKVVLIPRSFVVALQAVGAAAGNMIAIHNVVAVSATVGLLGLEGAILRKTILPTLYYLIAVGIMGIIAITVMGLGIVI